LAALLFSAALRLRRLADGCHNRRFQVESRHIFNNETRAYG